MLLFNLVLHRDVKLVLEGVDKYGNLFGTVLYSAPAAAPAAGETPAAPQQEHLAEQLLRAGLAKVRKGRGETCLYYVSGAGSAQMGGEVRRQLPYRILSKFVASLPE